MWAIKRHGRQHEILVRLEGLVREVECGTIMRRCRQHELLVPPTTSDACSESVQKCCARLRATSSSNISFESSCGAFNEGNAVSKARGRSGRQEGAGRRRRRHNGRRHPVCVKRLLERTNSKIWMAGCVCGLRPKWSQATRT